MSPFQTLEGELGELAPHAEYLLQTILNPLPGEIAPDPTPVQETTRDQEAQ